MCPPPPTTTSVTSPSAASRAALLDELRLEIALGVRGIALDPSELTHFRIGSEVTEQCHLLFDMNRRHQVELALPEAFFLPHGLFTRFRWDADSPYILRSVDGQPGIYFHDELLAPIEFYKRPPVQAGVHVRGPPDSRAGLALRSNVEGRVHLCEERIHDRAALLLRRIS